MGKEGKLEARDSGEQEEKRGQTRHNFRPLPRTQLVTESERALECEHREPSWAKGEKFTESRFSPQCHDIDETRRFVAPESRSREVLNDDMLKRDRLSGKSFRSERPSPSASL